MHPTPARRVAALVAFALSLTLVATIAPRARAQDTTSTANLRPTAAGMVVVLTLVDGSVLQGRVVEVTPTSVRFQSALGETLVPRSAIESLRTLGERTSGRAAWPEEPSRSRLFFAPTGRMLRSGESYFSDAYIFFPSFQVGLSDKVSVGAGLSLLPGVPIEEQLYYLTPKVGIVSGPDLNISVGALVAGAQWASDQSPFGLAYAVATFGGEDANVSTGAGVAYSRSQTDTHALLMLGGTKRTSKSIALVSENYLYTGLSSSAILSGGVRFIGEKLSVDLAGFFSTEAPTFPIPYVAFIYKY
jgi:hypothetical protein